MRVVIIDDDALVRASLKTILEGSGTKVLAAGSDGGEAEAIYAEHRPDVLVMDIRMKEVSGIEAGEKLLKKFPAAKILFLTTFSDDEYIIRALKMGAGGYILKQDFEALPSALAAVAGGHKVFGREVAGKIPVREEKNPDLGLTEKETELIKLVAGGLNNKEISAKLFLSEGTVRNYLSDLLFKLDLRDRTQLAVFYYKYMA